MGTKTVQDSSLTAVANAIRARGGTSALLEFPDDFVDAIGDIPGGGGTDYLAQALNNTITEYSSDEVTLLRQYAFAACGTLQSVSVPNCIILNSYAFQSCAALRGIVLPKVNQINGGATYVFSGCNNLAYCDLGEDYATVGSAGIGIAYFNNCARLQTLIIRTKSKVVPLGAATSFNGSPFANGGTGGTIYIPKDLYDHLGDGTALDYKSATNWSTVDGYGTITWAKIEGSQYEHYYADGTEIPT